jgi:hypothetical protein
VCSISLILFSICLARCSPLCDMQGFISLVFDGINLFFKSGDMSELVNFVVY